MISNHMIFLVQFGINKLWARAILLVIEKKITRAYLFQIALEMIWLPIQRFLSAIPSSLLSYTDLSVRASRWLCIFCIVSAKWTKETIRACEILSQLLKIFPFNEDERLQTHSKVITSPDITGAKSAMNESEFSAIACTAHAYRLA